MAAEGDQVGLSGVVPVGLGGTFEGRGHGQEGVGNQGDHALAVPGVPAGDLAFVEVADLLRVLEIVLHPPPEAHQ